MILDEERKPIFSWKISACTYFTLSLSLENMNFSWYLFIMSAIWKIVWCNHTRTIYVCKTWSQGRRNWGLGRAKTPLSPQNFSEASNWWFDKQSNQSRSSFTCTYFLGVVTHTTAWVQAYYVVLKLIILEYFSFT